MNLQVPSDKHEGIMMDDVNNFKKEIQEYLDIRLDMIRLHTAEQLSRIISRAMSMAITGYLLFFILLFLSFAAGFMLGSLLDSNELGFLLVALFYSMLLTLFFILKKKIIEKPVIKTFVRLLFPKFDDNEKQES